MSNGRRSPFPRSKNRSAVVLLDGANVCLIERNRAGRTYYLFPGGGVEPGESHEETAIREAKEELGVDVRLLRLIADITFRRARQTFYLARIVGGQFGTGTGAEMASPADSKRGSYTPVWLPLSAAVQRDTRPIELVKAIHDGSVMQGAALRLAKP